MALDEPTIIHARPPKTDKCRGTCMGTDRPVWDSPAAMGKMPDGTTVVYCTCCEFTMVEVEEALILPNLMQGISPKDARRMRCDNCGFDAIVMPELKAQ